MQHRATHVRTHPPRVQPNAIDIYGAVTYYKIRGFALQPNQLILDTDPDLGYQVSSLFFFFFITLKPRVE